MKMLRQVVLSAAVVVAGLFLWITYVPAAQPFLDRIGVLGFLGIEPNEASAAQQRGRRGGGGPAQVIVASVGERALADRVSAIGDGRARHAVTVRASAGGVITEMNIVAGSYVQQGDIIVMLEDENEQIALEQARIEFDDAQAEAERFQQLQASGATTAVRLRETELARRSAELAVRQAEYDLSQRQIEAPISGWVGIIDLAEGDRVDAQDLLVTITDRSEILIDFRVPERVVNKIEVGQTFDVVPLGLSETALTGEISAIDTVVDRASRTLLVQGRVPNNEDLLRAGMAFSVNLTFPGESMLSIAPLAIQWSSEGPFVWVVRDGKVARVPVTLAQRNSDDVLAISGGLAAGDMVVTDGVQTLREGAEVVIAPTEETAAIQNRTKGERTL